MTKSWSPNAARDSLNGTPALIPPCAMEARHGLAYLVALDQKTDEWIQVVSC